MTEQHPITPPNELVRKWLENYFGCWDDVTIAAADVSRYIAAKSTQWGHKQRDAVDEAKLQKARDEELEACCEYLTKYASWEPEDVQEMRNARRSKPSSLVEKALEQLKAVESFAKVYYGSDLIDHHIHRALKRLQELEEQKNG